MRHRKELTAVWRRAAGWSWLPAGGPCAPARDAGHWRRPEHLPGRGGLAASRPAAHASADAASLTSPWGRDGAPDAARGRSPRGAAKPGAPGAALAGPGLRGAPDRGYPGARRLPSGGPRRPLPGPWGRGQAPPLGAHLASPDLGSPRRARARALLVVTAVPVRTWAAAGHPLRAITMVPRQLARSVQDLKGPGRHATPVVLASQAPRVLGETRPSTLDY